MLANFLVKKMPLEGGTTFWLLALSAKLPFISDKPEMLDQVLPEIH